MKLFIGLFLLLFFSQVAYCKQGQVVKHAHNGRIHAHSLPSSGLKHTHNKKKIKSQRLKSAQKPNNDVIARKNYWLYMSHRKELRDFTRDEISSMKNLSELTKDKIGAKVKREWKESRRGSPTSKNNTVCFQANGASVIAQDDENTYLGKVISRFENGSIFNKYGTYGTEYNNKSIWNKYSTFGDKYSLNSSFNNTSSTPPMHIKQGKVIGYLSSNKSILNSISPNLLKALCEDEL